MSSVMAPTASKMVSLSGRTCPAFSARPMLPARRACVRAQASRIEEVSKVAAAGAIALASAAPASAAASEIAQVAATGDGRLTTILTLFVPVLGWVGFNMLQPALNQLSAQAEFAADVASSNTSSSPAPKALKKALSKKRAIIPAAIGAGAALSMLAAEQAEAAIELAQVAAGDGRLTTILTLFVPVLGWVGFNMLQPVQNQLSAQAEFAADVASSSTSSSPAPKALKKVLSKKRAIIPAAIGAGAALSMLAAEQAEAATELAQVAAGDGRLTTILTLFVPVLGWVGFNMLQPVLNQLSAQAEFAADVASSNTSSSPAPKALKKALSKKRAVIPAAIGAGAALSLLTAEQADAATEIAQVAASDGRLLVIAGLFLPVIGWVGFNILQPALNQLSKQAEEAASARPNSKPGKAVIKQLKKVTAKRK